MILQCRVKPTIYFAEHNSQFWSVPTADHLRPFQIIFKDYKPNSVANKYNIRLIWKTGSDLDLYCQCFC